MDLSALALRGLLGSRKPIHTGRFRVACQRELSVRRDGFGVAYIDAQNEADAWFGLGFCHAQDRAGQLEVTLRLTRGTLSELVGREGLHVDRAVRLIGFSRAAARQLETFDPQTRAQLEAYTAGINAAFACGAAPRSHEHVLLRSPMTPWQPADCIALGLLTCCFLPSNWDLELARLLIWCHDGPDAVAKVDPNFRRHPSNGQTPSELFLAEDLSALQRFLGPLGGSNAWAVAPHKTAHGRALLANDPHLPANLPNLGYLARVVCPSFEVTGVSLIGIPAFITGHNGYAAWGTTAAHVDNVDLFLEELGPGGKTVREGQDFVPIQVETQSIVVKGEAPLELEVASTARGPIVARSSSPEQGFFRHVPGVGGANALSFAATWLEPRPTRALLGLHHVRSFEEFRETCAAATGCSYSLVYADPESIGWLMASEVPRRKSGYGSLPLPGWSPHVGWIKPAIPAQRLPWSRNPESGFVSCANDDPVREHAEDVFLGHDFLDHQRKTRIGEVLREGSEFTIESMQRLQMDVLSIPFRELRSSLIELRPKQALAQRAVELLAAWDGQATSDSVAATVFELFLSELGQRVCAQAAPRAWQFALGQSVSHLIPGTTFNYRRGSFLVRWIRDSLTGTSRESFAVELGDALHDVMLTLRTRFGEREADWVWGAVRPLQLRHRLGTVQPLAAWFNRGPYRGLGNSTTINMASVDIRMPLRTPTITAHLRAVYEIGNFEASRFVLLGGQSGNPLSAHYTDLVPFWQRGEGVPIHCAEAAIDRHAVAELRLVPA
ncbi:MAG TPA: penicillin acylase family protein [Polyangiaceae bacterium]|nr:penicillin acylase family protein [Polyangiaceae bacterium]